MMIRLYSSPKSANARKIHLALEEVGADYEIVHLDLARGDQKKPEYLDLNPNGKVPTIVDGDLVLWESNAILAYLADKYPATDLLPPDRLLRARANMLLFWQASVLGPAVGALVRATRDEGGSSGTGPQGEPSDTEADSRSGSERPAAESSLGRPEGPREHGVRGGREPHALDEASRVLEILGGLLSGRPHAVGDRFGIADLALGPHVQLAADLGVDLPDTISAWRDALRSRKSWKKVYAGG